MLRPFQILTERSSDLRFPRLASRPLYSTLAFPLSPLIFLLCHFILSGHFCRQPAEEQKALTYPSPTNQIRNLNPSTTHTCTHTKELRDSNMSRTVQNDWCTTAAEGERARRKWERGPNGPVVIILKIWASLSRAALLHEPRVSKRNSLRCTCPQRGT